MDLVVERLVTAHDELGAPSVRPLWVPPLPSTIGEIDLSPIERPPDRLTALVGLADYPERQTTEPFAFDLTGSGHAMVSGLLGFGKSTTLVQVGADLALHHPPSAVHLYGVETGGGSLALLTGLPHVGASEHNGDAAPGAPRA
jgi:S-DNA-T family DNA segregation ATPase FtsK/SpoIIIE